MLCTVYIGTISMQGTLMRRLPNGMARVAAFGRCFTGYLVAKGGAV